MTINTEEIFLLRVAVQSFLKNNKITLSDKGKEKMEVLYEKLFNADCNFGNYRNHSLIKEVTR